MGVSSLAVMVNSLLLQWERPADLPQPAAAGHKAPGAPQRKPAAAHANDVEHVGSLAHVHVQQDRQLPA